MALAIMIADRPTPPQPCTATHSPGVTRPWSTTARNEVTKRQPRLAAVAKSMLSGRATRLVSAKSSATYSAKEPQAVKPGWNWFSQTWWLPEAHSKQRPQPATKGTVTRSPSFQRVTRLPTAAILPASSWPGTCGRRMSGSCPIQPCQSLAAEAGRLDLDDHAFGRGRRVWYVADVGRLAKCLKDNGFHRRCYSVLSHCRYGV